MADKIRIVSDGTAQGTKVFSGDKELSGITQIAFLPIVPGGELKVNITFMAPEIDVVGEISGTAQGNG